MPIVEGRDDGEETYTVVNAQGQVLAGPFNNRAQANAYDQSLNPVTPPANTSSSSSGGGGGGGGGGGYNTGIIGGQEYLIPTQPIGTIPAAEALMAAPLDLPEYEVAGLSDMQLAAIEAAPGMIGAGQPYLETGAATTASALGAAQAAGADPFSGLGETAFSGIEEGMGAMSGAADTAAAVSAGIPGLLQPGQDIAASAVESVGDYGGRGAEAGFAASEGILDALGSDDPIVQQAISALGEQGQFLQDVGQFGLSASQEGMETLRGTLGEFDPTSAQSYMDPYERAVVDQVMADLARQGDVQQQQLAAQAAGAGAFGGSRMAVAQQALNRDIMEQQAKAAAQLRSAGYGQAMENAMTAYENAMGRGQTAASTMGSLGQAGVNAATGAAGLEMEGIMGGAGLASGQVEQEVSGQTAAGQAGMSGASLGVTAGQTAADIGLNASGQALSGAQTQLEGAQTEAQIGQGIGSLGTAAGELGLGASGQQLSAAQTEAQIGQQQANMGEQLQGMNAADINLMTGIGSLEQTQLQNELDAERMTEYQEAMAPYQQVGFLSDIVQGSPMGSMVTQTQPGPSTASQVAGLMVAGAGLLNAGA